MSKKLEFNNEARKKLLSGAAKLSAAVTATLGPFGRNVIIEKNGELPQSTKDGVTVAKSVTLEDPIENIGAEIVKQASIKSANLAGDGTTTTTLLAHAIADAGLSKVDKGANAIQIKRQIDEATKKVVAELRRLSEPVTEQSQIKNIASISANNDEVTGELISSALEKVGKEGIVTIEESKTGETYSEFVEGMQFNRGYKSPYFVTDNSNMQAVLKEPAILIYDGTITQAKELLPLLESVSQRNDSLLVVAQDIDGEALATLIVNKARGILKVCAVKAPDFGERRTLILEDLATLTGGKVISKEKGIKLDKLNSLQFQEYLGKAGQVTVTKELTTVIDGKGGEEAILNRAQEIKDQIDKSTSMFDKQNLQERLAKLASGVAIIYVGGGNEIEMKEYKDRVEDALFAAKAAIEEGILPGGGVALFKARDVLYSESSIGSQILYRALSMPFKQILLNAGYEEENVYDKVNSLSNFREGTGFDLKTESWVDMKAAGVIDPTKVVRLALENASSVAGTLLTTECVIYEKPVENKKDENQFNENLY
jgi:chaperonin GroEL